VTVAPDRRGTVSLDPAVLPGAYEPRATIEMVLHQVVRLHLDRFLTENVSGSHWLKNPSAFARSSVTVRPVGMV
jgi:hypothetical protein